MEVRVFGIRHHGPGSSRRLRSVFGQWTPDCVLIEGPSDGQLAIKDLVKSGMEPPVALVLYAEKNIEQAAYLPFTAFSPEYHAARWAMQHEVPCELIDLPATNFLVIPEDGEEQLSLFAPAAPPSLEELTARRLRKDPLSILAEIADYTDSERWWDAAIERSGGANDEAVFGAILAAIQGLREAYPGAADEETLRREAYMRKCLRAAIKAGHERIAVVVGAWHGPALADYQNYKISADNALLKKLPKIKVKAAWVPWSYPRLARSSGYGAGLVSPAWYEYLFTNPNTATERWMVAAAQLLRKEGFAASPALAADAVALAKNLAAMRNHLHAGTQELDDALLSTLAAGMAERLTLIREELTIGRKVGKVPPGAFTVPLLADLQKELKSTRLTKLWETAGEHYLKATKTNPRGGIDLRQANDLRKSHLLHRLHLLDISWGTPQPLGPNTISSFKEIWLLEWQPEYSLFITERSSYGNTLPIAAGKYSLEKARNSNSVQEIANLILAALQAALAEIVPPLVQRLRDLTTKSQDVPALLSALPTLVNTTRYGDSRKTDTTSLLLLIAELVPRVAAGLPNASVGIDQDQAQDIVVKIANADYAIGQLAGSELVELWHRGLEGILSMRNPAPAVNGLALRLLYDKKIVAEADTANHLRYALSSANTPLEVAGWLAGFLYGSSQLLLHYPPLWQLVSEWVSELSWEEFEVVLPLLRRSLSDFKPSEKRELFRLVERPEQQRKSVLTNEVAESCENIPAKPHLATPEEDNTKGDPTPESAPQQEKKEIQKEKDQTTSAPTELLAGLKEWL